MNSVIARRILPVCCIVLALVLALGSWHGRGAPAKADNVTQLRAPSFREADMKSTASFLEDEAGIAAYTQASSSIDLAEVRGEFRTIERETDDYIIGSVAIPDYSEDHAPHVYVHADGWVMAYYLSDESAAYIIDLRHYDGVEIGSTKLEDAIYKVLLAVDVVSFEATYYDFRYPNATHIMLIAEAAYEEGDETFDVFLPGDFTYYESSWSHAHYDHSYSSTYSELYVDDTSMSYLSPDDWGFARGDFTVAQLTPGESNSVRLELTGSASEAYCGIALVYQEVP